MTTGSENENTVYKNIRIVCQYVTSTVLLLSALALLGYELVIFVHDVFKGGWKGIAPKDIFRALILSTTSVAFVGMHYVVNILIKKEGMQGENKDEKGLINKDLAVFFSLMANAVLLAGLIVVYYKLLSGD